MCSPCIQNFTSSVITYGLVMIVSPLISLRSFSQHCNYIFSPHIVQQPLVGQARFIIQASRTHSGTPHSVGLLWKSVQPDAEASTWQHTTLTTDTYPYPGGIRTRNPSKQATTDPRLRPRGHRNRRHLEHENKMLYSKCYLFLTKLNRVLG